ncbi:hypothetical protein BD770DRAFT_147214 [Pilaira anomala]|nr:hypothetical protein BD770DRAFT_147214 [Pilaira anomala]
MDVNDSLEGKSIEIQQLISNYRHSSGHEKNVDKQDVLYFGIIDLVRTGESSATRRILKEYLPLIRERVNTVTNYDVKAKNFAKQVLSDSKLNREKIKREKKKIKREKRKIKRDKKKKIKDKETDDISIKSNVIKIIKLVLKMTKTFDKDDWINAKMTENEFTTRFLTPLGDYIAKGNDCVFRPGEQSLELVKQYENNSLNDDETRLPGPRIDGLIISSILKVPFVLFEVSGPPCDAAANYSHFKGDRNKIAKNLKFLFKQIITSKGTPTLHSSEKIKLFGAHVYKDTLYIYSLSMPLWDLYVFNLEFHVAIPSKINLFPSSIPKFINKIHNFRNLISIYHKQLAEFFKTQDYGFIRS